jgi:hypothetical protein
MSALAHRDAEDEVCAEPLERILYGRQLTASMPA